MLSRRLAAVLTVKGGWVVQSIRFQRYLPVGRPEIAVEFLNQWGIDEIILLDIDASRERRRPDFEMVTRVSKKCFVPLTVGGGIRSVDHMRELIHRGADKVSLNSVLFEDREIIRKGAEVLGTQCIVVSMDVLRDSEQTYSVMKNSGSERTDWDPVSWAKEVKGLGAGEILLNSVDRDGTKKGYDSNLIKQVVDAVNIPVIACGGAGKPSHFQEIIKQTNASAVAAGNIFHFSEHSPMLVKSFLRKAMPGINLRKATSAEYQDASLMEDGRLAKRDDAYLEKLKYEIIHEEVI